MDLEKEVFKIIDSTDMEVAAYLEDMYGNVIKHNENNVYNSNSTIKAFILPEFFRQLHEGEISEDDYFEYTEDDDITGWHVSVIQNLGHGLKLTAKQCATLMIVPSDNLATNAIIDLLGLDKINENIRRMGFEKTTLFHPIDPYRYDPEIGQTTAAEHAQLFMKVYRGELISPEISAECLKIYKKQTLQYMFDRAIPAFDMLFKGQPQSPLIYIANKSGTKVWVDPNKPNQCIRNDGGIVSTVKGDFVCGMIISNIGDLELHEGNEGVGIGGSIIGLAYKQILENNGRFK